MFHSLSQFWWVKIVLHKLNYCWISYHMRLNNGFNNMQWINSLQKSTPNQRMLTVVYIQQSHSTLRHRFRVELTRWDQNLLSVMILSLQQLRFQHHGQLWEFSSAGGAWGLNFTHRLRSHRSFNVFTLCRILPSAPPSLPPSLLVHLWTLWVCVWKTQSMFVLL